MNQPYYVRQSPFEFPCSYPLKILGRNTNEFHAVVRSIIERHVNGNEEVRYHTRTSSERKYMSVTATFSAESKAQLDAIYLDLNRHDLVLMTL